MSQLQTMTMLLVLLALACAPVVYRRAQQRDQADAEAHRQARRLPVVMTGRQAAGRALYAETYAWADHLLHQYDNDPELRQVWEQAAALRGKVFPGRADAAG